MIFQLTQNTLKMSQTVKIKSVPLKWSKIKKEYRWLIRLFVTPTQPLGRLAPDALPMFQTGDISFGGDSAFIDFGDYQIRFNSDFSAN